MDDAATIFDGNAYLTFSTPTWRDGVADDLTVRVERVGLAVVRAVWMGEGLADEFVRFVEGMARDWRGWSGERSFASFEGELALAATHRGSHVRMLVEIGDSFWSATTELTIEPGEQLSAFARDVAALLKHDAA